MENQTAGADLTVKQRKGRAIITLDKSGRKYKLDIDIDDETVIVRFGLKKDPVFDLSSDSGKHQNAKYLNKKAIEILDDMLDRVEKKHKALYKKGKLSKLRMFTKLDTDDDSSSSSDAKPRRKTTVVYSPAWTGALSTSQFRMSVSSTRAVISYTPYGERYTLTIDWAYGYVAFTSYRLPITILMGVVTTMTSRNLSYLSTSVVKIIKAMICYCRYARSDIFTRGRLSVILLFFRNQFGDSGVCDIGFTSTPPTIYTTPIVSYSGIRKIDTEER